MKKITLLVANILLLGNVAKASELLFTDAETRTRFSFEEPIAFNERGIEFFVFPNGDFDFNTRSQDSQGTYFYKSAGKKGNDRKVNKETTNYGTLIEFDSFGRVRRVGNTFINYDFNDRVNRIGSVYMRYNRFALSQIGGLKIIYNRFGDIVDMVGNVKGNRNPGFTNSYYSYSACNADYDYNNNNYYYKSDETRGQKIEDKK